MKPVYSVSVPMVEVKGGTFQMGSTGGDSVEMPVHAVTVSDFSISPYEVTQELYRSVMGTDPSCFKGNDLPVEQVTWYNAVEFCNRLSQRDGLTPAYTVSGTNVTWNRNANGYRLPTEAEWEYAARGGSMGRGYNYSGSNTIDDVAWYYENGSGKTHPVGQKRANEPGLYDMSGNVWEWCWDWYSSYSSGSVTNPSGPGSGSCRVNRGGGWYNDASCCRAAYRGNGGPGNSSFNLGFRLCLQFNPWG